MEEYKAYCIRASLTCPSIQELAVRRELYGTGIECLIIVKRLLATICIDDSEAVEANVQSLAQSILDLQKQPSPGYSWLFMGHEIGVAQSVILTKDQWGIPIMPTSFYERRIVSRERYVSWVEMLQPR